MTDQPVDAFARAKPYGWIGLPISLVAILVLGTALSALLAAVAFGVGAALVGWYGAVDRVSDLFQAMKGDPQASEWIELCGFLAIYMTIAVVILGFAWFRGRGRWRDLIGWHPWRAPRLSRFFSGAAAVTLIYSFIANEALVYFYPASQSWVTMPNGVASIVVFFIVATVSAPVTEELIFRGWLFTALRAKLPAWPSILVSAALFALAHWESTHLYALVVFPVGIALGLIRERTGSLKASMTFHALYNGIAFVLTWFGH